MNEGGEAFFLLPSRYKKKSLLHIAHLYYVLIASNKDREKRWQKKEGGRPEKQVRKQVRTVFY